MLITVLNLPWSYVVVKTPSAMATECTEAYGLTAEYVQILGPLFIWSIQKTGTDI